MKILYFEASFSSFDYIGFKNATKQKWKEATKSKRTDIQYNVVHTFAKKQAQHHFESLKVRKTNSLTE